MRPVREADAGDGFGDVGFGRGIEPEAGVHEVVQAGEDEGEGAVDRGDVVRVGGDGGEDAVDEVGGGVVEAGIVADQQAGGAGEFGFGAGAAEADEVAGFGQEEGDVLDEEAVAAVAEAGFAEVRPRAVGGEGEEGAIVVEEFDFEGFGGVVGVAGPADDAAVADFVDEAPVGAGDGGRGAGDGGAGGGVDFVSHAGSSSISG